MIFKLFNKVNNRNVSYLFILGMYDKVGLHNNDTSEERKFTCTACGRCYKHKKSLILHQRYECGKEPQFQCNFCPYKAKQKVHVRKHMSKKHNHFSIAENKNLLTQCFLTSNNFLGHSQENYVQL